MLGYEASDSLLEGVDLVKIVATLLKDDKVSVRDAAQALAFADRDQFVSPPAYDQGWYGDVGKLVHNAKPKIVL